MDLLQHGVDRSVIALWLRARIRETTQMYLHGGYALEGESAFAHRTARRQTNTLPT